MGVELVVVTRGGMEESRHRGSVAVVDDTGATVFALGDPDAPVFPRSTVKAMLALPLVEGGAADRLGLTDAELALCCASHGGLPEHAAVADAMLRRAGRDVDSLECGAHWPTARAGQVALVREGREPTALHNNCSGKHAGFVCASCDLGIDPAGYSQPEHAVMRAATACLAELTGAAHDDRNRAVDGCGIPTHAIPLRALALGFARFGSGVGTHPDRVRAAARLRAAVAAAPAMVSGPGRFDTVLSELGGGRVFPKMGAEGMHAMALPELGVGIAVKCDDGAGRAAEVVAAALLRRFGPPDLADAAELRALERPSLRNWAGTEVGNLRPAGVLAAD